MLTTFIFSGHSDITKMVISGYSDITPHDNKIINLEILHHSQDV